MCLTITKLHFRKLKPKKAKKNIKVYKILLANMEAPIQNYRYRPNRHNPIVDFTYSHTYYNLEFSFLFSKHEICAGYHAFTSLKAAIKLHKAFLPSITYIHVAYIPKGAQYYKSKRQIVSNSIVVTSIVLYPKRRAVLCEQRQ